VMLATIAVFSPQLRAQDLLTSRSRMELMALVRPAIIVLKAHEFHSLVLREPILLPLAMWMSRTVGHALEDIFVLRLESTLPLQNALPGTTAPLGPSTPSGTQVSSVQLGTIVPMVHPPLSHVLRAPIKISKAMRPANLALLGTTARLKLQSLNNAPQVITAQHPPHIAPRTHVPLEPTVTEQIYVPQRNAISVLLVAIALLLAHCISPGVVRLGTTAVVAQQCQLLHPTQVEPLRDTKATLASIFRPPL
jgi:hypothetical protein